MLSLCLLGVLVLLLVLLDLQKYKKFKDIYKQAEINYPYLPFLGHSYLFLRNAEVIQNRIQEVTQQSFHKEHGVVFFWMANQLCAGIGEPESARAVLKQCLDKGATMRMGRHLLGDGVVLAPVSIWRPRRKYLSQSASLRYVNNFFEVFVRNSAQTVRQLAAHATPAAADFSMWDFLCSFNLNTACETIYGKDLNLQDSLDHPFSKSFIEYFENMRARIFQFWLHSDTVYRLSPTYARQAALKRTMQDFANSMIDERRELLESVKTQTKIKKENNDYVNMLRNMKTFSELISGYNGKKYPYGDEDLLNETITLLVAATDTSATASGFVVLLLSQFPAVQDKVYEEILDVFGESDREVTLDDIDRLKYLDAVVKESLRLYPPVPVITRRCEKSFTLPSGLVLHENCETFISIWGVHHNPRYWGPDAEEFRPERFLAATPQQLSAFIPFSFGNRNCLGARYALLAAKTLLVGVLRRYRVLAASSYRFDGKLRVKFDIMTKHVDKFKIRLEERRT